MCLVFLDYFPKIDLNQCGASFKLPPYLKAIGLHTTGLVQRKIITIRADCVIILLLTVSFSSRLMRQGFFPQTGNDFAEKVITPEQLRASRQMIDSLKGPVTGFVEAKTWDAAAVKNMQDFYSEMTYSSVCNGVSLIHI